MSVNPLITASPNTITEIKHLLTFNIREYNDTITTIEAYQETPEGIRVPRHFTDWYPEYHRYVVAQSFIIQYGLGIGEVAPRFPLREYQKKTVSWAITQAKQSGGAIIHAECGAGKTVMLLNIAKELGRTTLILVDREVLFDQWIEEITNALDVDPSDIGRIGRGFNSWRGKPFILATVQTLVKGTFDKELLDTVGTLVCDEVHLFAAPTFNTVVGRFPAVYRLGGTATPRRGDKLESLYFFHIGRLSDKVEVPPEYKVKPTVYIKPTKIVYPTLRQKWSGKPDNVAMTSSTAVDEKRNWLILKDIVESLDAGRHNLILCDRTEQRDWFFDRLTTAGYEVGIITRGMKTNNRKEQFLKKAVTATHHIAKYGLNIPTIDCIFDIGVYSDPTRAEQSGGRSMRKVDKKDPIVVCYEDNNTYLRVLMSKRERLYKDLGWKVIRL